METAGTGATWHTEAEMHEPRPNPAATDPPPSGEGDEHGVQQLARQAQDSAGKLADNVQRQILTQLAGQKDRATAALDGVAQAMREAGKHLHGHGQAPIAHLTDRAAGQVERASGYLSRRDVPVLRAELEQFARARTPLFVGGALAIGWLGARFLKSGTPTGAQNPAPAAYPWLNAPSTAEPLPNRERM